MLSVVVIAVVSGVVLWAVLTQRSARLARPAAPAGPLDPSDLAELEARWGALEADHARRRDELLVARLRPLVARRVPVRVVEAVPERQVVRIRFADGTSVVGRGEAAGDAGVLAARVKAHSVFPGACSSDEAGTHLVLDWLGAHHPVSMLVTGLDQPD